MEWKVPYYNILNMLLIGICFAIGTIIISGNVHDSMLILFVGTLLSYFDNSFIAIGTILACCFEIGLIINRMGSVILEEVLRHQGRLEQYRNEKAFNDQKTNLPILDILAREYASSRSQMMLYIILLFMAIYNKAWITAVFFAIFIGIFYKSLKKYDKRISEYSKNA